MQRYLKLPGQCGKERGQAGRHSPKRQLQTLGTLTLAFNLIVGSPSGSVSRGDSGVEGVGGEGSGGEGMGGEGDGVGSENCTKR